MKVISRIKNPKIQLDLESPKMVGLYGVPFLQIEFLIHLHQKFRHGSVCPSFLPGILGYITKIPDFNYAPSKKSSLNRTVKRPRKNGSMLRRKTLTRGQEQDLKTYCQEGDPPGLTYSGYMNVSKSGKPCRVWMDRELQPQQRTIPPHNYCRNPSEDSNGVYCITERNNSRWEYCSVPICGGTRQVEEPCLLLPTTLKSARQ